MKKTFLAFTTALLAGFIAAVGLCIQALRMPQTVSTLAQEGMRIVVDAGHGGVDGGVTGKITGVKESDVNLGISHKLCEVLTDMGFEVTLTRKTEAGLYGTATKGFKKRDMLKRKEIIQKADPDMVISVHQNFYAAKTVRGGQVFYAKDRAESKALAVALQGRLNGLYKEYGVKERKESVGNYFMLECHDSPSVIVECGFLSNVADEELLVSETGQRKIAETIAAGVVVYLSGTSA